jgi:prophage antirepressor-like protein
VAKPFQDWMTREVLPAIRETGGYMLAGADRSAICERGTEVMPLPTSFADALRQHAETLIKLADEQEAHARTEADPVRPRVP